MMDHQKLGDQEYEWLLRQFLDLLHKLDKLLQKEQEL
jgi:hypothetical protein